MHEWYLYGKVNKEQTKAMTKTEFLSKAFKRAGGGCESCMN